MDDKRQAGIRNTIIVTLLLITVMVSLVVYKLIQPRYLTPDLMEVNHLKMYPEPIRILPFSAKTANQQEVSETELQDQWSVIVFTDSACEDECSQRLKKIAHWYQSARTAEHPIKLYSVSIEYSNMQSDLVSAENQWVVNPNNNGNLLKQLGLSTTDQQRLVAIINPKAELAGYFTPSYDVSKMRTSFGSLRRYYFKP